ncbi:hypothetical protein Aph01nite_00260 [Acrocarpospora phusangensis]|uniref:Uncharacterized protein n=1 Tax=Acrocarpospora phusangensis TaxID=1070424 RepID=A0A919Q406_9ACTN|nr:hypothetical protein Aph01nite_00260 [Acrocarpospora phusangensis]
MGALLARLRLVEFVSRRGGMSLSGGAGSDAVMAGGLVRRLGGVSFSGGGGLTRLWLVGSCVVLVE